MTATAFWGVLCCLVCSGVAAAADMIPDNFVIHESGAKGAYAVIVEKSSETLILYDMSQRPREVFRIRCSTGKNFGPKTLSGDAKTPEGVYFFIQEHEKKYLSPIYGVMAFPTDYPNLVDRLAERTGSAIWLHGTDKPLAPYDSNGCIAVENADLLAIAPFIALNRTPIIIVETVQYLPTGTHAAEKKTIRALIAQWHRSLSSADYENYAGCYAALPAHAWWNAWEEIQRAMRISHIPLLLDARNLAVYKQRNIFVALFEQYVQSADTALWVGTKKIFLEYQNDRLVILGDTYQVLSDISRQRPLQNPLITAVRSIEESANIVRRQNAPLPSALMGTSGEIFPEKTALF